MNIDSIKNGIVIDHIAAGKGMQLYDLLGLDKLDCSVAIIKNVSSKKMGRKDIIKVDADVPLNLDVIGFVDPEAADGDERHQVQKSALHHLCRAGSAARFSAY